MSNVCKTGCLIVILYLLNFSLNCNISNKNYRNECYLPDYGFHGRERTQIEEWFGLLKCCFWFVGYWIEWGSDDGWMILARRFYHVDAASHLSLFLSLFLCNYSLVCEALLLSEMTLSVWVALIVNDHSNFSLSLSTHKQQQQQQYNLSFFLSLFHSFSSNPNQTEPFLISFLLLLWDIMRQWWYFMLLIQTCEWSKEMDIGEVTLCLWILP